MMLNTSKFVKLCGVSTGTIRYWARKGVINFGYTDGGQRRYSIDEVENSLKIEVLILNIWI